MPLEKNENTNEIKTTEQNAEQPITPVQQEKTNLPGLKNYKNEETKVDLTTAKGILRSGLDNPNYQYQLGKLKNQYTKGDKWAYEYENSEQREKFELARGNLIGFADAKLTSTFKHIREGAEKLYNTAYDSTIGKVKEWFAEKNGKPYQTKTEQYEQKRLERINKKVDKLNKYANPDKLALSDKFAGGMTERDTRLPTYGEFKEDAKKFFGVPENANELKQDIKDYFTEPSKKEQQMLENSQSSINFSADAPAQQSAALGDGRGMASMNDNIEQQMLIDNMDQRALPEQRVAADEPVL